MSCGMMRTTRQRNDDNQVDSRMDNSPREISAQKAKEKQFETLKFTYVDLYVPLYDYMFTYMFT